MKAFLAVIQTIIVAKAINWYILNYSKPIIPAISGLKKLNQKLQLLYLTYNLVIQKSLNRLKKIWKQKKKIKLKKTLVPIFWPLEQIQQIKKIKIKTKNKILVSLLVKIALTKLLCLQISRILKTKK